MCVTRVARVVSVRGDKARVKFIGGIGAPTGEVDVSMVDAKKNDYVEVFADQALSLLTEQEARWKQRVWSELRDKLAVAAR